METCLIVCPDPSGLARLRRCRSPFPIVVASDDPRVQAAARRMANVTGTTYVERAESFWVVAEQVKAVIARLDVWLASLEPEAPAGVMAWSGNIEGGITAQRVQDALLLIRSFQHLLREFDVREVQAIVTRAFEWEADVLEATAGAAGVRFVAHSAGAAERLAGSARRWLEPVAKAAYRLWREIRFGATARRAAGPALAGAIVFQLCSSLRKHVDNVSHLMAALDERGERAVALCWGAGDRGEPATTRLHRDGLEAVSVEAFITLTDVCWSLRLARSAWSAARRRRQELATLHYEGVPLAPLFAQSIRDFVIASMPSRLRYARALDACAADARPAAIKPWGGGDAFEGRLALDLFHRRRGAVYFHYWVGAGLPGWPYTDVTFRPALFLAKSVAEGDIAAQEYRISPDRIEVVGLPRWSTDGPIAAAEARRTLHLAPDRELYVGVDAGAALRGYQSRREQVEQLLAVLEAAKAVPGLAVAIKPHPSYGIEHLRAFVDAEPRPNVVVLPASAPVPTFLGAIDVLVSKYSTLLLEAALAGRCGIAALLDNDMRFRAFGDLFDVVTSGPALEELLVRLASDPVERTRWIAAQRARHSRELPLFYRRTATPATELAADAIVARLHERRSSPATC